MSSTADPRRKRPQRRLPRNGGWPLLVIVALAVGLRLLAWRNAVQMTNDGVDFLWQARHLLDGDVRLGLAHPYHPLFALMTAGVARLTGDVLSAALAVSITAGVLIVMGVHALSRLALPNRPDIAWAAALMAALHERTLLLTSDITSDGLFLGLFLLALAMLFDAEQSRRFRWRMAAAGALAGMAYLTRPEGVFLLGVAALWLLLGVLRRSARRGQPLPRPAAYLGGLVLFLAGMLVMAGPYLLAMHELSGTWGLSLKPSMAAAGLGSAPAWAAPADAPIASPRVGIGADDAEDGEPGVPATGAAAPPPVAPERDLRERILAVRDGVVLSVSELYRGMRLDVLVLAGLGLPIFLRRRRGLLAVMLALMAAWVVVGTLQFATSGYLARRHMLAPALLALPLAGGGLVWLWGARRAAGPLRLAGRGLVVLLLVAAAASGARTRHTNHLPRVQALQWASAHSEADERIGVRRRKDGHDAARDTLLVWLPCQEAELLAAMERYDVRLLVLDLEDIEAHAPHWLDGALFEERVRFGTGADTVVVLERGSPSS
jgi:4-amino-4-deoxy-L-arabinose transferase-like glycosyltransferase